MLWPWHHGVTHRVSVLVQDFAAAGADMFTFHLEPVTEERGPQPDARVWELTKRSKGRRCMQGWPSVLQQPSKQFFLTWNKGLWTW